jgi:hypothetical protein
MNYPPRQSRLSIIRENLLWSLACLLNSVARRLLIAGGSLREASDRVACYEFTTRTR